MNNNSERIRAAYGKKKNKVKVEKHSCLCVFQKVESKRGGKQTLIINKNKNDIADLQINMDDSPSVPRQKC